MWMPNELYLKDKKVFQYFGGNGFKINDLLSRKLFFNIYCIFIRVYLFT